jgi:hypothetical protein
VVASGYSLMICLLFRLPILTSSNRIALIHYGVYSGLKGLGMDLLGCGFRSWLVSGGYYVATGYLLVKSEPVSSGKPHM